MSTFGKSQYIWLESFFRDELYRIRKESPQCVNVLEEIISNLSSQFRQDSPHGFDTDRFYRDIFNPLEPPKAADQ